PRSAATSSTTTSSTSRCASRSASASRTSDRLGRPLGSRAAMPVRRVIDLSMPLDERTPYYPGDPAPRLCVATTIARDGFNVTSLDVSSHLGTHCDAPYHFLEEGARIDELPFERFVGPGVVVDVTGLAPRTPITWEHLAPAADAFGPGVIVLLRTGWDVHRASDRYFTHPYLDGDACA